MSSKENSLLADKITNKIKSVNQMMNLSVTKENLILLLENTEIKNKLQFFVENIFNEKELKILRDKINFYSLNKENLDKLKNMKERKEKLKNLIEERKVLLSNLKERKKEIVNKNVLLSEEVKIKKKEEETILVKNKILEYSKRNGEEMIKDFNSFSVIENYKYMRNNNDIVEEHFSFDDFLDQNKKFFEDNFLQENFKKIPTYSSEKLKDLHVNNFLQYFKDMNIKLNDLKNQIKNSSNDLSESEIFLNSKLENKNFQLDNYNTVLKGLKEHYQDSQVKLIEFSRDLSSSHCNQLKKENENLIKTFKIESVIVQKIIEMTFEKIDKELEIEIEKRKVIKSEKRDKKSVKTYYEMILKKSFSLDNNLEENIEKCKSTVKLFRKLKNRIDNFIDKYFLSISSIIEEKYSDLSSLIKQEAEIFKMMKLGNFYDQNKLMRGLYPFRVFNYNREILNQTSLFNKIKFFEEFFRVMRRMNKIKNKKNELISIKALTVNNPYWQRFCLLMEKYPDIINYLSENFEQTRSEFSNMIEKIKFRTEKGFQNNRTIKDILKIWERSDFIDVIKLQFPNVLKEIKS